MEIWCLPLCLDSSFSVSEKCRPSLPSSRLRTSHQWQGSASRAPGAASVSGEGWELWSPPSFFWTLTLPIRCVQSAQPWAHKNHLGFALSSLHLVAHTELSLWDLLPSVVPMNMPGHLGWLPMCIPKCKQPWPHTCAQRKVLVLGAHCSLLPTVLAHSQWSPYAPAVPQVTITQLYVNWFSTKSMVLENVSGLHTYLPFQV